MRRQHRSVPLLSLWRALFVEGRHDAGPRTQGADRDGVEPGAEIVRVQHRRAVLLERAANPEQRRDAHAVDGEHLDVDALLLREPPDRSVLSEPDDAGIDAACAAARRELHDELLQAAQPQPVDQVGNADAHAQKVGMALAGG